MEKSYDSPSFGKRTNRFLDERARTTRAFTSHAARPRAVAAKDWTLEGATLKEMEALWDEAKAKE